MRGRNEGAGFSPRPAGAGLAGHPPSGERHSSSVPSLPGTREAKASVSSVKGLTA